mgnify:CR=1 FL=1
MTLLWYLGVCVCGLGVVVCPLAVCFIYKAGQKPFSVFDIHVFDVYFTGVHSNPRVFDTSLVAMISNLKQEL